MKLWKVNVIDEVGIKEKLKDENEMKPQQLFKDYFKNELNGAEFTVTNIHVIGTISATTGKCLPTFYLSNERFAVTKYRVCSDLFFALK